MFPRARLWLNRHHHDSELARACTPSPIRLQRGSTGNLKGGSSRGGPGPGPPGPDAAAAAPAAAATLLSDSRQNPTASSVATDSESDSQLTNAEVPARDLRENLKLVNVFEHEGRQQPEAPSEAPRTKKNTVKYAQRACALPVRSRESGAATL
jgi:hypothetical protein